MKKTKILLVDDDLDFLQASKAILEQSGFEVMLAEDGKKGLKYAKSENPDLIILDVMLPDINGFSICRELKQDPNYSAIPIIMMTAVGAKPDSYTEQIAKEHSADYYIAKPVDSKKMIEVINDLLAKEKPTRTKEGVKARILLVDDDPDFLDATKQILIANKYEVITAKDGEEGIAKAKHDKPDLIILDVIMPGKDGYTVCYELRKIPQTRPLPIIMLTAIGQQLSMPDYAVDIAIDHLADDFIDKPVKTETLIKKIEKHLLFR